MIRRCIHLAIASTEIRHRRYLPKAHAFETQLTYLSFDPDQLSSFTQKSWLWSCQALEFPEDPRSAGY